MAGSVDLGSRRYLNQQLCSPAVAGVFASFWASALNQGHAVFSMSPLMSLVDGELVEWAKRALRLHSGFLGMTSNGGSLANLAALSTARNYLTNFAGWRSVDGPDIRVWSSEFSHYSIKRATQMIGLSSENYESIPVDPSGAINISLFTEKFTNSLELDPLAKHIVVLTLGNTFNGAFDDVKAVHELVAGVRERVWLHVDAAHGGSFYHVASYEKYFSSLHACDSVVWNPHKLMFQPIPLSLLFYRSLEVAGFASDHDSPYLSQSEDASARDMHRFTLECSRSSLGFKLWLSLQLHGEDEFKAAHLGILQITKSLGDKLSALDFVELHSKPVSNIVCFTVAGRNDEQFVDYVVRLLEDGGWSIGKVKISDRYYLRICVMRDLLGVEGVATFIEFFKSSVGDLVSMDAVI
jgi:L-2,4-diaminobutyrate decarboxylase